MERLVAVVCWLFNSEQHFPGRHSLKPKQKEKEKDEEKEKG